MSFETLKNTGVHFFYSHDALVQEIPYVQDVLFALHVSAQDENYIAFQTYNEVYVANVHLVAAAVGFEVISMRPYDEAKARKIIAKAITELCPENVHHLFINAFAEEKRSVEEIPVRSASYEEIVRSCECMMCRLTIMEHKLGFARKVPTLISKGSQEELEIWRAGIDDDFRDDDSYDD